MNRLSSPMPNFSRSDDNSCLILREPFTCHCHDTDHSLSESVFDLPAIASKQAILRSRLFSSIRYDERTVKSPSSQSAMRRNRLAYRCTKE